MPVARLRPHGAARHADPNYLMLSGTSTSAPLVAGAAALMVDEDPSAHSRRREARASWRRPTRSPEPPPPAGRRARSTSTRPCRARSRADGYALSAYVGDGKNVFKNGDYQKWEKRAWSKYGWTKFKWTKFKWTKFKWTKSEWTEVAWTKFKWTKFKWTQNRVDQVQVDRV